MRRRSIPALVPVVTAALLALAGTPALAATAGQTLLIGGLTLPAGAIPAGWSGHDGDAADRTAVTADGRYVAFVSSADALDPAAHPDVVNVYRKDRVTGAVTLVSRATGASGAAPAVSSLDPRISDDGNRIAFRTTAALDSADTDGGAADVYVRDVAAATTTLVSQGDGGQQTTDGVFASNFDLSGNGRYVVFGSSTALDAVNDANGQLDVYRRDLTLGRTTLVSRRAASASAAAGASSEPSISDDGTWVAFTSSASDLVAGFVPGSGRQAFVRDMTAAVAYLVSDQSGAALTGANGDASEPDVAGSPASGRTDRVFVAFTSQATNGAAGDADAAYSVYRRQLTSANAVLVSQSTGGANADSRAHTPSISDDGTRVVFASDAGNLGAGADYYGVYLRDLSGSTTTLVSAHNAYAVQGALSGDGGFAVWYESGASADSDPDLPQVFGRVTTTPTAPGAVQLVSRPAGSAPFLAPAFDVFAAAPGSRAISADGRYVVFTASSAHLPGTNGGRLNQVYRRDALTGTIELVSRAAGAAGAPSDGFNADPSISADGMRVAFTSNATNLDPAASGANDEVYVRDLASGATTLASRAEGAGGAAADRDARAEGVSADGRHVLFRSGAGNLGVAAGTQHLYLRDLDGAHTQLVDRATGAAGAVGGGAVGSAASSRDGRVVVFTTDARLDPDDADTSDDVYVRDTAAQTTALVSRRSGLAGAKATTYSSDPSISADGRVVAFEANDETLATEGGGWGGRTQIVARTLATGANVLVSRAPGGAVADDDAYDPSVDGDGSVIAFDSEATNLLPGLGGGVRTAVFARTMATGTLAGPPAFGLTAGEPQDRASAPSISDDGQCLAFTARGHNAATGYAGDFQTAYVFVVSGQCPKPLPVVARRTAAPRLSHASLTHTRFRVGRRATAKASLAPGSAAKRRRARRAAVGTTFRFTLSARANVAIAFERQAPGRLVGRFCKRPTHRLRRHLRCVRWTRVGRISRGGLRAGANRIAFSGRIGRTALAPGTYRARLRASNSAGVSAWVTLKFAIVR